MYIHHMMCNLSLFVSTHKQWLVPAMCKPYLVESFSRFNGRKFVKGSFVNNHTEEGGTCVGREKNGSLYSQTEFLRVLVRVYRAQKPVEAQSSVLLAGRHVYS